MDECSVQRKRRLGRLRTQKWRDNLRKENLMRRCTELTRLKKSMETLEASRAKWDLSRLLRRQEARQQLRVQSKGSKAHVPKLEFVRQFKKIDSSMLDFGIPEATQNLNVQNNEENDTTEKVNTDKNEQPVKKEINVIVIDSPTADDIVFETVYCGFFYPGIPEEIP